MAKEFNQGERVFVITDDNAKEPVNPFLRRASVVEGEYRSVYNRGFAVKTKGNRSDDEIYPRIEDVIQFSNAAAKMIDNTNSEILALYEKADRLAVDLIANLRSIQCTEIT